MTRTKLLTFLSALVCAVCLVFGIAACNAHEHTWSESWTTDSDYHWHAPNCDDTDEVKDKAAHVDANQDGKCDVCKYDVGHEHTFADGWTSDETHHWHEATCSHTNEKGSYAEHEDLDEDGECDTCHKAVEHKHRYAKEWSTDKDNHWHEATCSHQTEKSEFGAHVDEDQNGRCDVCDYEIGHEHSYEEKWTTSETQHWHAATCTHQNMKSELGNHDFDENGDCRTCHYHKHVFSEEWTVDQNKHWHVATCADGGDEKSNEEAHDFGFSGKCKCGVETIEINIYNMYYKPAQEFANEEVKDFGAWHAELVKAGVKHIELDVLTQDVIYTYDNPDGEDIKEVKYGSAKIVNVKITKGSQLKKDVQGLPDVTFKVIAKIDGEPVANGKALGTGKINKISGEGEITFMPYFGYSSAKNHAGQKIEYAITLAAEGDKDYVEITKAYIFTSEKEVTFTVSGDAHAETFTGNFEMERALDIGEAGKITGIDFDDSQGGSGYGVFSSFYIDVPAGWYMLSYDDGTAGSSLSHVSAAIDDWLYNGENHTNPNPKYVVTLYYAKGERAYDGVIYIPEGAERLYLEPWNNSTRNGTLRMEPYEFPELKTDGSENYVIGTYAYKSYETAYYSLPADTYKFTASIPGSDSLARIDVYINDEKISTTASSTQELSVIIKESDKINFKVYNSGNYWCNTALLKINKIEYIELNEDSTLSFASDHKTETKALKVVKDGLYTITLKSESDLRYVSVGYGVSSTNNLVGTASAERKEIETYKYLKSGETLFINIGVGAVSVYPEAVSLKITEAKPDTFTLGESASITMDNANNLQYRSFTATKEGYYTFSASSTSNISYFNAGVDGSTNDLINVPVYGITRYAASNVFYAKKGVPVIFTLSKGDIGVSKFTVNCVINEVGEFASAELNSATEFKFSKDKLSAAYSFTATEVGEYRLTVTSATKLEGLRVVRLGEEITQLLNVTPMSSSSSTKFKVIKLTLEKDEKVDLLFLFDSMSSSTYPTISFTVNNPAPTALTVDKEETLKFSKDLYAKTYTFTATEAGSYMLVLSASSLNYIEVLNGEGKSLFSGSTSNLTFANAFISLEKGAELTLVFSYNSTLTSEKEIKLTLNRIVSEDLTANGTKDVTLGNGTIFKSFNFTATDEAYYSLVLSSETSLNGIKIIDGETGADIVKKITSSSTKFSFNAYKLTAGQKINFLIVNERSAEVSLKFRVEYDTPKAMTANNNVAITFSADNNAEYYSFTATEAGYYAVVLTSETDLKNVQVYNAATNGNVGSVGITSKYYIKTLKLAAAEKINFVVRYNSNASYPAINVRVEYDTPTAMTANEDKTIEFSKDNLAEYYTFTATEAGVYMRVLTTETDLKNLQIINAETGVSILTKVASTKKYDVARFSMTAGQKLSFLVYYDITAEPESFPTIDFRIEYRNATELTVNKDTEVTFKEGQNAVYLSFTATDANYYTLVLNADEAVNGVNIYNAKTNEYYGTVSNAKFFIYNKLKLAAKEQVTFLIYFNGAENYPTFKFRVEYDTPKALTANTAEKITFSATNNAEYYSFTASEDAAYALVLTSETSLKNVSIVNLANGNDLLAAITTTDKSKVVLSSATALKSGAKLDFIVLYKGNENHPAVELKVAYNKPTEMTANTDTSVTFAAGKNVEYLSFTAAGAGQYALQLTSDTSLKNIQVYNGTTGVALISNITTQDKTNILVSSATKFTQGGKLVLAVVYNGAESYPTVKVKMVMEAAAALNMGANTVTFAAGTHVKTVSYSSEEAKSIVFGFSAESGLTDVKVYNGTTGASLSLSNGKTATQSIAANTPFVMIITYTGSPELKLTVNVMGLLSAPANLKVDGYTMLTWDAVPNATKYKITWDGNSIETNKNYFAVTTSISSHWGGISYSVVAIDETGKYGDSEEATVKSKALNPNLNRKITVTVKVPEGFPTTPTVLKVRTFRSNQSIAGNFLEVTGPGTYECVVLLYGSPNNDKVALEISASTLPEGFTCNMVSSISGGSDRTETLEITKKA